MLLERLLDNLSITIEPFAVCEVEQGCELVLEERDSVTVHFVLSGSGTVKAGNKIVYFAPDHFVLIPHQRRHVMGADNPGGRPVHPTPSDGLVRLRSLGSRGEPDVVAACGRIRVRFGGGPALFGLLKEPLVLDFSDSPDMQTLFDQMLDESSSHEAGSTAMLTALMNRCLVMMFRELCHDGECPLPWLNALEDDRLALALDQMLQRPGADHSLESLAQIASMSRTSFAAEFKSAFGSPPMTFLRHLRLRKAAKLLRDTTMSAGAIAARVGFSSRPHFSTAFRDYCGSTPADYRRQHRH